MWCLIKHRDKFSCTATDFSIIFSRHSTGEKERDEEKKISSSGSSSSSSSDISSSVQ
jgi:hypothetical protein